MTGPTIQPDKEKNEDTVSVSAAPALETQRKLPPAKLPEKDYAALLGFNNPALNVNPAKMVAGTALIRLGVEGASCFENFACSSALPQLSFSSFKPLAEVSRDTRDTLMRLRDQVST